jgi:hypothetical protein
MKIDIVQKISQKDRQTDGQTCIQPHDVVSVQCMGGHSGQQGSKLSISAEVFSNSIGQQGQRRVAIVLRVDGLKEECIGGVLVHRRSGACDDDDVEFGTLLLRLMSVGYEFGHLEGDNSGMSKTMTTGIGDRRRMYVCQE